MKPRVQFMPFTLLLLYTIAVPVFFTEQTLSATNFLVTSANDSGVGTLRQAILDLNNSGSGTELHTVTFDLNITTINLLTPLPAIKNSVVMDGFEKRMIDCSTLFPAENPELFSAAITVTIDGSFISTTGSIPIAGLAICADDVVIRGLRITNFANKESAQIAGIATNGENTIIECCEVKKINGNNSNDSFTVIGIQGKPDTLILKCFVHNLKSVHKEAINLITETGGVTGIALFKTAYGCRVENLRSGSIIHSIPGSSGPVTLLSKEVIGITNQQAFTFSCTNPSTRQCLALTDCEGPECATVENCLVNCCQSGSISATEDASVLIGTTTGINITSPSEAIIKENNVCNIYSGNATLTKGTFTLIVWNTLGININNNNTTLYGNTIRNIHRGTIELGGLNSSAQLLITAGIYSNGSNTIIAKDNTISNIACQQVTASGTCTTIHDTSLTFSLPCISNFSSPLKDTTPICAGIFIANESPHLCNNTVTNINAGKRAAEGEQSLITSGYAAGIFANGHDSITAENNTVKDIFGAILTAGPVARGIFGDTGSKGIVLWFLNSPGFSSITVEQNTVTHVCEQSLHLASNAAGGYTFLDTISDKDEVLRPAAQTIGISIKSDQEGFSLLIAQINNNTIDTIIGSKVNQKSNSGTMAIGINIEPAFAYSGLETCMELTDININSTVQNNSINNILGGTNNSAYGIILNNTTTALRVLNTPVVTTGLFSIQNNTITNLRGFGLPQSLEAPLLSLENCDTIDQKLVTFVPFPYQPTSGIYTLFGNCSTIQSNIIHTITDSNKNARGITTQASNDMEINHNSISNIHGYGIFVGGATAHFNFINNTSGLLTKTQFEQVFASTRNKIFSNSTFNNTKKGIKLGIIDWNSYFKVSQSQCKGAPFSIKKHQDTPDDSVTIIGNHGQVAPCIEGVSINREKITIDIQFNDSSHIFTNFIIQFFANNSHSAPHGENPISNFSDPQFIVTTDINGSITKRFNFTPTHPINKTDTISAHITVAEKQPSFVNAQEKNDTSEFTQQQDKTTQHPFSCHKEEQPYSFIGKICG